MDFKIWTGFITLYLVTTTFAVNRTLFRTCQQVDFCNRLRENKGPSYYNVDPESIELSEGYVKGTLYSTANNEQLYLKVSPYSEDIFRVIIEGKTKRYRLQGALKENLKPHSGLRVEKRSSELSVNYGNNELIIWHSPFKMEFYSDGDLVSTLNGEDLLVYETETDKSAVALDVSLNGAQHAYGLPEHADNVSLRTTYPGGPDPYRLYNLDVPTYEVGETMALYGSIPVLYGHGAHRTSGVFWHNAAETWVEITNKNDSVDAYFITESGVIDIFVLMGPSPEAATRQYASLTGTAPLPQYFTLAYHQCRWNYETQEDVEYVIENFDKHDLPLDVMWLDIEYTDAKKYFTWNPVNFSNPERMVANIEKTNRKLVVIIDPHIKKESGYRVYEDFLAHDLFVKNPNGSVFEGDCWPGRSSYIDFLNPKALDLYASYFALDKFPGTSQQTYIWNDMNEPSVFNDTAEKTAPKNLVHHGNVSHRDVHNIYALYQTSGTYKGLLQRSNHTRRPFILTRAHFAGSQRYTAVWTGDNTADWNYISSAFSTCISEALSGISFCGGDVGGFFGDPSEELLQRWYQAGAWLPFYRAHANLGTKRREPYLFNKEVRDRIRKAIRQKYVHLPYWYTLFWEHYQLGDPVIRPLFYHYPKDVNVLHLDSQILVGKDIMVVPITQPGVKDMNVYFPGKDVWYDAETMESYEGGEYQNLKVTPDRIPVFYRAGSIVCRQDTPRSSSALMKTDPYSMYVFVSRRENTRGRIYLDDGESFNYTRKDFIYMEFEFLSSLTLIGRVIDGGLYKPSADLTKIVINLPTNLKSSQKASYGTLKEAVVKSGHDMNTHPVRYTTPNQLEISVNLKLHEPFVIDFNQQ